MYFPTRCDYEALSASLVGPVFLVTWLPFGLGKLDCGENRKISRNVGDAFDPERAPQETEGAYS
jgi:hypothetical protein